MRVDAVIQDRRPFPVRVEVLPSELFRSLIVRLAHAHDEKIQSFGFRLVGKGRTLFGDDVDRGQWAALLKTIERRAFLPEGRVLGTTLRSYEGVLYERMAAFGPAHWVLPVSQTSTYRRWAGLQYCAACLADDEVPYFRLTWRLAFYIWCDRHSVLVHDRCPECGSPVTVHRLDVGGRTSDLRSSLLRCPICGHDRRSDAGSGAGASDREAISLQLRMLAALQDGVGHVGDDAVHSLPYFTGMAILVDAQ